MELDTIQDVRWLRSRPTSAGFAPDKIDADTGILYDVVMVEEGEAKGHGVHLEAEFVAALVEYDKRHFTGRGIKARFGHPSASSETMGTQMGVFKNFRKRKTDGKMQAIADLHLLDAAEESPTHPGMRSWVLKMAAEQPDFIMSSIVFRGSGYYQRKPNGHKYTITDGDYREEFGNVFVEFDEEAGAAHYYTDLVEAGAATESLFSNKINAHLFVAQAGEFLADHPELKQFIQANPEKVTDFFKGIGISLNTTQPKKMSKFSLSKWLFGEAQDAEPAAEDLDTLKTQLSQAKEAFTALKGEKDALDNRAKELSTQVDALQANVAQLKTEAEALKADATAKATEIAALKSEAAAEHTGGETEPGGSALSEKPYLQNPIYLKALAMRKNARKQQA